MDAGCGHGEWSDISATIGRGDFGEDGPVAHAPNAILIIGASAEAERVIDLIGRLPAPAAVLGCLAVDPDSERPGTRVQGFTVLNTLENILLYHDRVMGAVLAVESVEDRERAIAAVLGARIPLLPLVDASATVGQDVRIGPGVMVHAQATVETGSRLGLGVRVGPGAILEVQSRIGDGCSIGSGAIIGSKARVGERVLIHRGAILAESVLVGPDAIVEPGSCVLCDIAQGERWSGSPARVVQPRPHPELDGA